MKKTKKTLPDILWKWSLSYVLISVIAIGIFAFCFKKYSTALRGEMEYTNSILIESMRMQLDKAVGELQVFSSRATLNAKVRKLRQRTSFDDIPRYDLYELVRELGNDILPAGDLRENPMFLYFPQMDFMISGSYYNNSYDFFQIVLSGYGFDYGDWYNMISQSYRNPQIFLLPCSDGTVLTVFLRPVDSRSSQAYPANAVMIMNTGKVNTTFEESGRKRDYICIVDPVNSKVISEKEVPGELQEYLLKQEMTGECGSFYTDMEGKRSVISYISSSYEDWKYVVVTTEQNYLKTLSELQRMVTAACLIYLVLSMILAFRSIMKHYRPIRSIADSLGVYGGESEKTGDTYARLSDSINSLLNKNKENRTKIYSQYHAIRNELFRRLLIAENRFDVPDEGMLKQYNLQLGDNPYVILAYHLEGIPEYGENWEEKQGEVPAGLLTLTWFILQNVTEENMSLEKLSVSSIQEKELLVFLIADSGEADLSDRVKRAVSASREFSVSRYGIQYRAAVSEAHKGAEEVSMAYRQAERVLEFQKNSAYAELVSYGDINVLPTDTMLSYPLEVENRLFHSIQVGDDKLAFQILDELVNENKKNCLTWEAMQFLTSNLASTILRAVNHSVRDKDPATLQKQMVRACSGKNLEVVLKELKTAVKKVCEEIRTEISVEKAGRKSTLYQEVKEYVEANYVDSTMSVNDIAGKFGIPSAALSRLFKESEGENLSQYINRVRLVHARELIMQNKKLEEVAIYSGYGSQRTFLRIFKQYEGVTPTQFKDLEEKKKREGKVL
nr:helix-turn-helix domain-containing protein [uncultured Clostridium sp.]